MKKTCFVLCLFVAHRLCFTVWRGKSSDSYSKKSVLWSCDAHSGTNAVTTCTCEGNYNTVMSKDVDNYLCRSPALIGCTHSLLSTRQTYLIIQSSVTRPIYSYIHSSVDISIRRIFVWNLKATSKGVWWDVTREASAFFSFSRTEVRISKLDMKTWKGHVVKVEFGRAFRYKTCLTLKVKGDISYPFDINEFRRKFPERPITKPTTTLATTSRLTTTKVPTTATNLPTTTTKIPTTTRLPTTTAKLPPTSIKFPTTTTKVVPATTKLPTITTKLPKGTTGLPTASTKLTATTTTLPKTSTKVRTTATKLATTTAKLSTSRASPETATMSAASTMKESTMTVTEETEIPTALTKTSKRTAFTLTLTTGDTTRYSRSNTTTISTVTTSNTVATTSTMPAPNKKKINNAVIYATAVTSGAIIGGLVLVLVVHNRQKRNKIAAQCFHEQHESDTDDQYHDAVNGSLPSAERWHLKRVSSSVSAYTGNDSVPQLTDKSTPNGSQHSFPSL